MRNLEELSDEELNKYYDELKRKASNLHNQQMSIKILRNS